MFRKLSWACTMLAFLVILTGAYVRYSNADLSCPDWPTCYGSFLFGDIPTAGNESHPGTPSDSTKVWKAMAFRYLLGGLLLTAILLSLSALLGAKERKPALGFSAAIVTLTLVASALEMMVVKTGAMPIITTALIMTTYVIAWNAVWLLLRTHSTVRRREMINGPVGISLVALLIVFAQIWLGTWVNANDAALACQEFPRCQGEWLPNGTIADGFNLAIGSAGDMSAAGKQAIHALHRMGGLLTFLMLSVAMLSATSETNPTGVRRSGVLLSALLLVEVVTGIFSVKHGVPLLLSLTHDISAALIALPLFGILFFSRYSLSSHTDSEAVFEQALETDVGAIDYEAEKQPESAESLYFRLRTQLKKTRSSIGDVFSHLGLAQNKLTQEILDDVEASLLMADLGLETTAQVVRYLRDHLSDEQIKNPEQLSIALKQKLFDMLQPCSAPLQLIDQQGPFVILVVGVNGAGKTTSIGKLAHRIQAQGKSVMLAAGDTFRAAAVEQLQTWGERNHVTVVAQHTGADSASVIFDALQSAQAKQIDVLIADTAGRLHTKSNLMDELAKIKRIMAKLDASAPHEILLVLDAGTGQNALSQARLFNDAVGITGLALTKLDGTAKGGVIFALASQLKIPIRFIGVGEGIDDLQDFDAQAFVDALFVSE